MPELTPWEQRKSYYKGLELGKDVKTLTSTLNKQTNAMIASQMASASAIVVSQERIREGIGDLSIGIDRVADGIVGLQATFEWGIGEIVWQIEQNRQVLKSILEVLSAPLDTQAKELRKRAKEAYQNGWFDDALTDFLESEIKNRYDFSVHISLGNIYLFKKDKTKALEYFEKAIKYAKPKSAYYTSYALLHKGIIKHSAGLVKEAEECTDQAVDLSPKFAEALYQNAQYNAQLKNTQKAIQNLGKAINLDKFYVIKADNDHMFDPIRDVVNGLIEKLKNEINVVCKRVCNDSDVFINSINKVFREAKEQEASKFHGKDLPAKSSLTKIQKLIDRNSYFDSLDAKVKLPKTFAKVKGYKEKAEDHLYHIVCSIESKQGSILIKKEEKRDRIAEPTPGIFLVIGIIISLFPGIEKYSALHYSSNDPNYYKILGSASWEATLALLSPIPGFIMLMIYIAIGAAIGYTAGMAIQFVLVAFFSADKSPKKVKELESQKKIFEAYLEKLRLIPIPKFVE